MYKEILNKILEYNNISIFRHVRPDGDCVFSSLALYHFLKDNFKDKNVKVGGFDKYDLINRNDKISTKFIQNSLVFVLDVSTKERIDDNRALKGNYIIRIDHHPGNNSFGDINAVNSKASSASQILAEILLSKPFSKYICSNKVCKYLYCGILTDTINFKTTNTTASTLNIAAKLVKKGEFLPSDLVEYLFNSDLETYKKITNIRNELKVDNKFGYIQLNKNQLIKLEMTSQEAKNNIDAIGNINDLNVWALAVEENGLWDCSIRSKKGYVINNIANKYRGGGHANASAVKQISKNELKNLFHDLTELSSQILK